MSGRGVRPLHVLVVAPAVLVLVLVVSLLVGLKLQADQQDHNRTAAHTAVQGQAENYAAELASEFDRGVLVRGGRARWGTGALTLYDIDVVTAAADSAQAVFAGDAVYARPDFLFGDTRENDEICYRLRLIRVNGKTASDLSTTSCADCLSTTTRG
ncbi:MULTISPECIES: hypothetical protein [Streptacidiphilus]|nr:hypothetical protein [Streptacidiphilus jeojiense]